MTPLEQLVINQGFVKTAGALRGKAVPLSRVAPAKIAPAATIRDKVVGSSAYKRMKSLPVSLGTLKPTADGSRYSANAGKVQSANPKFNIKGRSPGGLKGLTASWNF